MYLFKELYIKNLPVLGIIVWIAAFFTPFVLASTLGLILSAYFIGLITACVVSGIPGIDDNELTDTIMGSRDVLDGEAGRLSIIPHGVWGGVSVNTEATSTVLATSGIVITETSFCNENIKLHIDFINAS